LMQASQLDESSQERWPLFGGSKEFP